MSIISKIYNFNVKKFVLNISLKDKFYLLTFLQLDISYFYREIPYCFLVTKIQLIIFHNIYYANIRN